jgi:hypothetical protein
MKKLTMFFLVAVIGTTTVLAQDTSAAKHKMHDMGHMKMKKDCVMMKEGKMLVMKEGKTMAMDQEMTLTNGSTVSTDGTLKMQDGTTKQLKDGDCVYMDGKMMSGMKKDPAKKKATKPD